MEKANHVLASFDKAGSYEIVGGPFTYLEGRDELRKLQETGSSKIDKVALISLRRGTVKRRPIGNKAPAKKAAKKTEE